MIAFAHGRGQAQRSNVRFPPFPSIRNWYASRHKNRCFCRSCGAAQHNTADRFAVHTSNNPSARILKRHLPVLSQVPFLREHWHKAAYNRCKYAKNDRDSDEHHSKARTAHKSQNQDSQGKCEHYDCTPTIAFSRPARSQDALHRPTMRAGVGSACQLAPTVGAFLRI